MQSFCNIPEEGMISPVGWISITTSRSDVFGSAQFNGTDPYRTTSDVTPKVLDAALLATPICETTTWHFSEKREDACSPDVVTKCFSPRGGRFAESTKATDEMDRNPLSPLSRISIERTGIFKHENKSVWLAAACLAAEVEPNLPSDTVVQRWS